MLVVSLILLVVLVTLALSSMSIQSTGLTMAGNVQFQRTAFQAAESGIDIAINRHDYTTAVPAVLPETLLGEGSYSTAATTTFLEATAVPDSSFSMGEDEGTIQAYHFEVVATGTGPDSAQSVHNQSFYLIGPKSD